MKRITLLICALGLASCLFAQEYLQLCGNINYKPQVQTVLLYADENQLNDPIIPLDNMLGRLTLSFDIIEGDGEVLTTPSSTAPTTGNRPTFSAYSMPRASTPTDWTTMPFRATP